MLADLAGCFRGLLGERLHLGSNQRKAPASLARPSRLDSSVEGKQVCLTCNCVDQLNDLSYVARGARQLADAIIGFAGLVDCFIRNAR